MDIKKFKLGVGPMSKEIVNLCLEYSAQYNYPIMIIASRNQVDYKTGYAMSTFQLSELVKNNSFYSRDRVLLCRDHCGPYFSDVDKHLSLNTAIEKIKSTISADADAGFDLIHIDVSRVEKDLQEIVTSDLFTFSTSKNKNFMFEFGTEDNNGDITNSLNFLKKQLKWINPWQNNIKYIVAQTGSLTKQIQVGTFDIQHNRHISELIHSYGYLFKEHNADYLNRDQVKLRAHAGVDAINIAPQLGSICSSILYDLGNKLTTFNVFNDTVLNSGYWKRWCTQDVDDNQIKFIASAHYFFNHNDCKKLMNSIDFNIYSKELKSRIYSALDEYRLGFKL